MLQSMQAKRSRWLRWGAAAALAAALGCSDNDRPGAGETPRPADSPGREEPDPPNGDTDEEPPLAADVLAVQASGTPETYTFAVTLRSPDTGCEQYADWWEVLTPEGRLIYRRVLAHSHVDEQPFTRSGGPVEVPETEDVVVRAHMNDAGYGGVAFVGSVASGFGADPSITAALAPELADVPPKPTGCAF